MLHIGAVIVFIISFISTVSSTVTYADFSNKNYSRICTSTRYNPTDCCRQIAKLESIVAAAYPRIDQDVNGACQDLTVVLFNDHPNVNKNVRPSARIVLCNIGPNYKKCASASSDNNVIEHYDYTSQGCEHTGSMTMASSSDPGSGSAPGSGSGTGSTAS